MSHHPSSFVIVLIVLILSLLSCAHLYDQAGSSDYSEGTDSHDSYGQILAAPDEPNRVDRLPEYSQLVDPIYPSLARQAGIEGVAWIKTLVDRRGIAQSVTVYKSSGTAALDNAATGAASQNRFQPATLDGVPVECWIVYQVSFLAEEDLPAIDDFVPVERNAEFLARVSPPYPLFEEQGGIQGKVWIKALVNRLGEVVNAVVYKSCGVYALDMAALSVAFENRFSPAISNGKPTAVWVAYDVDFVLDKEKQ